MITVNGPLEAGWKHRMLANGYFYSGMPALVRPFRDRYQLALSRNGGWPRVSVTKRNGPSARILYYHRVNDENDPFFPAISTRLFEQEMLYIRRHYCIVSLAELVARLENRTNGPVVAVTFDDGYQDNHDNAFPILERYGIPATIFLTTGSMDTREPLWFEQLALAFKKTEREFIDLEMENTRLSTRSEAERLAANDRVFGILRSLADDERRRRLARILKQLLFHDGGERTGKLLTWECTRRMQQGGVDFGGHTVTHPFLSQLPSSEVTWEVTECKRRIEQELQRPVLHFAYPNGRERDFGSWNKELIRRAGYQAAVTTVWGVNCDSTDPMELRRGGPWESTAAMFAYKLDWYQFVND